LRYADGYLDHYLNPYRDGYLNPQGFAVFVDGLGLR
jgi:hypothetical protein